jgi:hypothetical protein
MTHEQKEKLANACVSFPAKKMHELLALALQALEKANKTNGYLKPDMGFYHNYDKGTDQHLSCLGGLAYIEALALPMEDPKFRRTYNQNTLAQVISEEAGLTFVKVHETLYKVERTVDCLRSGNVGTAMLWWYGCSTPSAKAVDLTNKYVLQRGLSVAFYHVNPISLTQTWHELLADLKEADL